MATIRNKDIVFENMLRDGHKYWEITETVGRKTICEMQREEIPIEQSVEILRNQLENIDGLVIIKTSSVSKASKRTGGSVLTFEYTVNLGTQNSQNNNLIGSINQSNTGELLAAMQDKFTMQMENLKSEFIFKQQILDLKNQLKENNNGSAIEKIAIGFLNSQMGLTPPAIAGLTAEPQPLETQENSIEDSERAENALNRLLTIDTDFLTVLEKLADMAENNLNKYNMAKNFL